MVALVVAGVCAGAHTGVSGAERQRLALAPAAERGSRRVLPLGSAQEAPVIEGPGRRDNGVGGASLVTPRYATLLPCRSCSTASVPTTRTLCGPAARSVDLFGTRWSSTTGTAVVHYIW